MTPPSMLTVRGLAVSYCVAFAHPWCPLLSVAVLILGVNSVVVSGACGCSPQKCRNGFIPHVCTSLSFLVLFVRVQVLHQQLKLRNKQCKSAILNIIIHQFMLFSSDFMNTNWKANVYIYIQNYQWFCDFSKYICRCFLFYILLLLASLLILLLIITMIITGKFLIIIIKNKHNAK